MGSVGSRQNPRETETVVSARWVEVPERAAHANWSVFLDLALKSPLVIPSGAAPLFLS